MQCSIEVFQNPRRSDRALLLLIRSAALGVYGTTKCFEQDRWSRGSLSPFSFAVLSHCSLSLFSLTVMYSIGRMARLARSPFILAFNGLRFERFSRTHFEPTGKQTNRSIYFFILEINQTALCLLCGYTALDWSRIKSVVLKANILVVLQHSSGVHKKCSEQNLLRWSVAIRQVTTIHWKFVREEMRWSAEFLVGLVDAPANRR